MPSSGFPPAHRAPSLPNASSRGKAGGTIAPWPGRRTVSRQKVSNQTVSPSLGLSMLSAWAWVRHPLLTLGDGLFVRAAAGCHAGSHEGLPVLHRLRGRGPDRAGLSRHICPPLPLPGLCVEPCQQSRRPCSVVLPLLSGYNQVWLGIGHHSDPLPVVSVPVWCICPLSDQCAPFLSELWPV